MDTSSLEDTVRPQDTVTYASSPLQDVRSLDILRPHKAEVLGYVSAQRSISPDLLRPLDLHTKRPSPHYMGASCSKSSSIGIASKAESALSANPQFADSPYLVSSPGSRKSSHTTKSVHGDSNSIPAIHQDQPSGQLQAALAASAASAVLSESAHTAATAVAVGPTAAAQQPSFAQQSFREASALYGRPLDRPSYNHKVLSKKANGSKVTIDKYAPFPDALKAAVEQHSWDAVEQLLQHHLFDRPDMKVMELDSAVAAIPGQPVEAQAACASLLVANGFFFAAMKAVFAIPEILRAVLEDVKSQVNTQQPASVDSWHWAAADLKLLLQQFRGLKVTQQYKLTQQQLAALGPEGKAPLARVEMEMLGKVVNDFLVQLGAQPSGESSAAGSAAAMSQPDAGHAEVGYVDPVGPPSEGISAQQGSYGQAQAGKGFRGSPGKTLTSSQIKKKKGLQQQREQLKAGERQKRQQAASLGVSPTVVARSQMSARSVAQQQVLTQRQQRDGAAAVAQQAAAEKLQLEQQALERDYEQLRLEKLRFQEEQEREAQQQGQMQYSLPQLQLRFAQQQQAEQMPIQRICQQPQNDVTADGLQQSYGDKERLWAQHQPQLGTAPQQAVSQSQQQGRDFPKIPSSKGIAMQPMPSPEELALASSSVSRTAQRTQHPLSELELQGSMPGQSVSTQPQVKGIVMHPMPSPEELALASSSAPRATQRTQHALSELELQGNMPGALLPRQGVSTQPQGKSPSAQELQLLAPQRAPGRDSPTRDLTELEQQGSFTLTPDQSRALVGDSAHAVPAGPDQAAELALELARRKGAQASLEKQYSQLQLQHQQSLERQRQAADAQQAQREQQLKLQQEAEAAVTAQQQQQQQLADQQRKQQEEARLEAERATQQAQQTEEEERQQQVMAREAEELARQRAELEAALAAERGTAQAHGYTPTPLATPKPKGRTAAADDEASEVEESQSSSGSEAEEEVYSEAEVSEVDDKAKRVTAQAPSKGKAQQEDEEEVVSSYVSDSDQAESEDYQEDFEDEEVGAAGNKTGTQSSSKTAAAAKQAKSKLAPAKQRRRPSASNPTATSNPTVATAAPPLPDGPDPTAIKWAAKNPWFGTDLEMTYFAYEVHDQLIEEEGITANMPEYYTAISARVEAQFPERFFPPGAVGVERQGPMILAGGQVSTTGGTPMYRQGSSLGSGIYRQGSSVGSAMYRQASNLGPTMYRQGSSIASGIYRQASAIPNQISTGGNYTGKLYRGSSLFAAALMSAPGDEQTRAAAGKRPAVPALALSRRPTGDRSEGPHSDRGVGSLYDRRTGTPRVPLSDVREEASNRSTMSQPDTVSLTPQLSQQIAADMAWAVGDRPDLA